MREIKVIRFMRWRKLASGFSLVLVLASIASLAIKGLNYGLDFTGGTQVEVFFQESPDLDQVQQVLGEQGYENYEAVFFGSPQDVLIRIQDTASEEIDPEVAAQTGDRVVAALREQIGQEIELQRSEYVGSVVGEELKEQGILGLIVSVAMMLIYIAMRFQWKFGVATVAALTEDVIITLGVFSFFQLDFDLTVLAAVLAVIGYGLNDTIVICDRIRENFRLLRKMDTEEIVDISLTQTLGRTLVTSLTTMAVLFVLVIFGGDALYGFSLALLLGVVVGTYSTIYVATNMLIRLKVSKEDLMPPARDTEELDAIP